MKLKNPNLSPPGGFYYVLPDGRTIPSSGNLTRLFRDVESDYAANGIPIPSNLRELIEDQICSRVPASFCYYTSGLGDRVSKVIHAGAKVIDKALGTNLETKARGCGGCGKRRMKLNKFSS